MAVNFKISRLLERYGSVLSNKQQRILDGYYNCDLSLSEIAENEGITRQGVSDTIKRSEAELVQLEDKLEICKKIDCLRDAIGRYSEGKTDIAELEQLIDNF